MIYNPCIHRCEVPSDQDLSNVKRERRRLACSFCCISAWRFKRLVLGPFMRHLKKVGEIS